MTSPLVEIADLSKTFTIRDGLFARRSVVAVEDFTLSLQAGESVGLVGESGSGKSTVARLLLGLIPPSAGSIRIEGIELRSLDRQKLRALRSRMQIVFQNPHTALHPRMTVASSLAEPLRIHGGFNSREIRGKVAEMAEIVSLPPLFLHRYPHELSGGQKQRICIARALMLRPKLLVLDEPTSALDVSVQAQILEFLRHVQREWRLAFLFISHNLTIVEAMCERVMVMRRGRVVESGPVEQVMNAPRRAYTRRLLAATLEPAPDAKLPAAETEFGNDDSVDDALRPQNAES